jgi:hypothetical protein
MDQPVVVPYLKSSAEMWENVQTMSSCYRTLVVIVFDVMRRIDVATMVEEVDPIQSHSCRYHVQMRIGLIEINSLITLSITTCRQGLRKEERSLCRRR